MTDEVAAIRRDFGMDDLRPHLAAAGIEGTVLMQAAPTEAETNFMLDVAASAPEVLGVVGWTDFETADAADRIAAMAARELIVGLRPMVQDIPDDRWLERRDLDPAFEAMVTHGLVYDALTFPRHLAPLLDRLGRHPDLSCVIDHASKPRIAAGDLEGWRRDMSVLARETDALVKLSGLVTEAGDDWSVEALRPVVDHLIEAFGPSRMVWGSDWPVCTLACPYNDWVAETDLLLADLTVAERAVVWGENAARLYGLNVAAEREAAE